MSVVGIDFGTRSCKVVVARRKGLDVVDNSMSDRQTPAMVAYTDQRIAGEHAMTQHLRNLRNTVTGFKRFMGVTFDESQKEVARSACKIVKLDDGSPGFEVQVRESEAVYCVEQVAAKMLNQLALMTEKFTGQPVNDCVIAVPSFWDDRQRRSMLNSSKIAGLNVLKLINEPTASALAFGGLRSDLLADEKAHHLLLFDMGYSHTQVEIVKLQKGVLTVVASAHDIELGGRNFDEIVAESIAEQIKRKYGGLDVTKNTKAWTRLLMQVEKQIKLVLSAGTKKSFLNIESLMEDRDISLTMELDEYRQICQSLVGRVILPITNALEQANMKAEELSFVELTGSSSRLSVVGDEIVKYFSESGVIVGRHLNSEESVARGACIQCAMLSHVTQVRKEFKVRSLYRYPIKLRYTTVPKADPLDSSVNPGEKYIHEEKVIIKKNNVSPSFQKLIFPHTFSNISMAAVYEDSEERVFSDVMQIGRFQISNIPKKNKKCLKSQLNFQAGLNRDGVFVVQNAEIEEVCEELVEVSVPKPKPNPTPAATPAANPATDATNGMDVDDGEKLEIDTEETNTKHGPKTVPTDGEPIPMESDVKEKEKEKVPAAPEKKMELQKITRRIPVEVKTQVLGLSEEALKVLFEEELKMKAADKLVVETEWAKNNLESYVYEMRDKINTELKDFGLAKDLDHFSKLLNESEDWLFEEGENVTKSKYTEKLDMLKTLGCPLLSRKWESEQRPEAFRQLRHTLDYYNNEIKTTDTEKYSHIDEKEMKSVADKLVEVAEWAHNLYLKQESLYSYQDPAVHVHEIYQKKDHLDKFCLPILTKPKPAPKPAEPEKKDEPEKMDEEKSIPEGEKKSESSESVSTSEKPSKDSKMDDA